MTRIVRLLLFTILPLVFAIHIYAQARIRVEELVEIEGIRSHQLVGYGIVAGLHGTGDSRQVAVTRAMIENFMQSLENKINLTGNALRNSAAVVVTADIPPLAVPGQRVDAVVASIGDARSLEGGILIQTALYGNDGTIYATCQGPVTIHAGTTGNKRKYGNSGTIPNGVIVEKTIMPEYIRRHDDKSLSIVLRLKKFHIPTARRISKAISEHIHGAQSAVINGSRVRITMPANTDVPSVIAAIFNLEVESGLSDRVVIDRKKGIVVVGNDVMISPVAVSIDGIVNREGQESLTDETAFFPVRKDMKQQGPAMFHLESELTVGDLVTRLNNMRISTHEIIALLKALSDAGALHGKLVIRQ